VACNQLLKSERKN